MGIENFAITSDGSKFSNPKHLAKHEANLKRKQRKLARKEPGSSNYCYFKKRVARIHSRVSRTREDFCHQLSRKIVNGVYKPWRKPPGTAPHENQVIVSDCGGKPQCQRNG